MQGNILGQAGGSLKINGIIEQYKVVREEKVNAGDFVKFINEITIGTDTKFRSADYGFDAVSAVLLNENKVFVAYSTSSNIFRGTVVIMNGTEITTGTDTMLRSADHGCDAISAVLLNENKVFIAYNRTNGSTEKMEGIVVTIEGTEITTGISVKLSSTDYTCDAISAVMLNENKVFVAHTGNTSSAKQLYGIVITINGNEIITGTDTQLSLTNRTGYAISAISLSENRVFIAHSTSGSYSVEGTVVTINENEIIIGINTNLSSIDSTSTAISAVLLNENKVFVAHSRINSGTDITHGIVITINEHEIITGTETLLRSTNYTGYKISAVLLSENKVFIANTTSAKQLYGTVVIMNGTEITIKMNTNISSITKPGYAISAVLLSENKAFVICNNDKYLATIIAEHVEGVSQIKNKSDIILGIAKTKGSNRQVVKVYVPKLPSFLLTELDEYLLSENGLKIII